MQILFQILCRGRSQFWGRFIVEFGQFLILGKSHLRWHYDCIFSNFLIIRDCCNDDILELVIITLENRFGSVIKHCDNGKRHQPIAFDRLGETCLDFLRGKLSFKGYFLRPRPKQKIEVNPFKNTQIENANLSFICNKTCVCSGSNFSPRRANCVDSETIGIFIIICGRSGTRMAVLQHIFVAQYGQLGGVRRSAF